MKKNSVIALFLFARLFSFGQVIYFDKVFDYQSNIETGGSIVQTPDTGYLFAEQVITTNYRGLRFIKINKFGDTLWSKMYSQTNFAFYDGASSNAIIPTLDGNYIVAACKVYVPSNNGEGWLIKLNTLGDTLWTKTFSSPYGDEFTQLVQNSDRSFVITGTTSKFSSGANANFWLVKTDSVGNLIWEKNYGGSGDEIVYSIAKCSDGGYILAGNTNSYGAGGYDFYIVKVDSNGNFQWQKTIGSIGTDVAIGIIQSTSGGYVVTGYEKNVGSGFYEACIAKLNNAGAIVWKKNHGGLRGTDYSTKPIELLDGSFVVGGDIVDTSSGFYPKGLIMKLNSIGDSTWTKFYRKWDIDSYFSDIKHTNDGGFVISGYAFNSIGFDGNQDMWVLKLDSNGCENINCLPSGIVNTQSEDFTFTIYPNPSNGIFTLAFNNLKESQLEIYDVLGKVIFKSEITSEITVINLSNQPSGIYFVRCTSENKTYSCKFVKE